VYPWKELNRKVRLTIAQRISFAEVIPEQAYGSLVPDLTCITGSGERLYVEIVVTHNINEEKFDKIREYNIPVLQVDMVEEQRQYQQATQALLKRYEVLPEPVGDERVGPDLDLRYYAWDWTTLKKQV